MVLSSTGWLRGFSLATLFAPVLIWLVPEALDASTRLPAASLTNWWSGASTGRRLDDGVGPPDRGSRGTGRTSGGGNRLHAAAAGGPPRSEGARVTGEGKDLVSQADPQPPSGVGDAARQDAGTLSGVLQTCTACVRQASSDGGDPAPWRCLETSTPKSFREFGEGGPGDDRRGDRHSEVPSDTRESSKHEGGEADMERHEEGEVEGEEGHGHGVESEEEEANEETEEHVERTMAAMTLGSVAFQMSLFYVMNYRDPEIKRYAHTIIGQTISIFCAVLAFNAIYGLAVSLVKSFVTKEQEKYAFMVFLMLFFILMQVLVYVCFHTAHTAQVSKKEIDDGTASRATTSRFMEKKPRVDDHVLDAKTYGSQLAQICGAAAMRTFGAVQYTAWINGNPVMIWAATGIAFMFFVILLAVSGNVRRRIILLDGKVDEEEVHFIACIQDCENEVVSLTLGFLWAVAARIFITGSVPEMLAEGVGARLESKLHPWSHTLMLFALGGFCALVSMVANFKLFGVLENTVKEETLKSDMRGRIVRLLVLSISLSFAWCTCFGNHMLATQIGWFKEGLPLRMFLALFQSSSAFLIIIMLDAISDFMKGPRFERAMVMLIDGLGVSVGLSWEHLFHHCVEVCVEFMVQDESLFKGSSNPTVWALWLSCVVIATVLPAFRYYMVPRMYNLIEEHEERMNEAEAAFRRNIEGQQASYGAGPYMPVAQSPGMEGGLYAFDHMTSALEMTSTPESRPGGGIR